MENIYILDDKISFANPEKEKKRNTPPPTQLVTKRKLNSFSKVKYDTFLLQFVNLNLE